MLLEQADSLFLLEESEQDASDVNLFSQEQSRLVAVRRFQLSDWDGHEKSPLPEALL